MANRILRFILDNDTEGTIQVDDPIGYQELELVLTRDEKFMAISSELSEIELGFYGEGRDYILNILDTQSFDNEIRIDIDLSTDKGQTYEDSFDGILDWESFKESFVGDTGHIASFIILRSDFFSRFMNHQNTKINAGTNIDLYGGSRETILFKNVTLHSQTILIQFISNANTAPVFGANAASAGYTLYGIPKLDDPTVEELDEITELTASITETIPAGTNYTLLDDDLETDREFIVDGTARIEFTSGVEDVDQVDMQWFVQRNSDAEISIGAQTSVTPGIAQPTVDHVLSSPASTTIAGNVLDDEFRVYIKIDVTLAGVEVKTVAFTFVSNNITIQAESNFEDILARMMLVHELGNRITNSITGTDSKFFSEYLGNRVTQIQSYSDDGCGSFYTLGSGKMIRGDTVSGGAGDGWQISLSEYFDGIDGILNMGLVVENVSGSDRVRMEPKYFFFQSGSPVVTLRDIDYEKTLATQFIYKQVDCGFSKWKSEDFNSIDDWSTNQVRTSRYATIGVDKDIKSAFVAASYAIESTRRKRITSESWRLDDDNFIIALNRSTDGSGPDNLGVAEKDENFTVINNILFESEAYNLRLSPARNFLRWGNIANVGLVDYAGDLWRWQGGEGNQDYESRIIGSCEGSFDNVLLVEKDDIQWDYSASPSTDEQTPLFKPIWYTFKTALSLDDYITLRDNKTNSFEIIARDGTIIELFLWELKYNLFQGQGTFKAIEANV